jgi:hypothetical protein
MFMGIVAVYSETIRNSYRPLHCVTKMNFFYIKTSSVYTYQCALKLSTAIAHSDTGHAAPDPIRNMGLLYVSVMLLLPCDEPISL